MKVSETKTMKSTKAGEIVRDWYEFDVAGKTVGRVATQIAQRLMGKSKPYFVKHLDCGDYVVIINAKDVQMTGKKDTQKIYTHYSGYPGGIHNETFAQLRNRKPEEIIIRAVGGMLPKNKLRDSMLKRLYVYAGAEHPHKEKFVKQESNKTK